MKEKRITSRLLTSYIFYICKNQHFLSIKSYDEIMKKYYKIHNIWMKYANVQGPKAKTHSKES
jgi:hypothetical protein